MHHLISEIAEKALDRVFGEKEEEDFNPNPDGPHLIVVKVGFADIPIYEGCLKNEAFGVFQMFPQPRIIIDSEIKGWVKVQTIYHELGHAISWVFGQGDKKLDEEEWVDVAAAGFAGIMRDNPEFHAWLLGFL